MSVIIVASMEPRAGRSLVAAAIAYRLGRAGRAVILARLAGDDSAGPDAQAFAALESIVSPGRPITAEDAAALSDGVVLEAPPGGVRDLAASLAARVVAVGSLSSAPVDAPEGSLVGSVLTQVPAAEAQAAGSRAGVLAVLPEDRALAAPSVADIARVLDADWLAGAELPYAIDRVMIGTVSSDAASPYFGEHQRTCVITRFDKTDIQLAALLTDLQCLVLTGGGEPSPYLIDRVAREDVAVLRTKSTTPDTVREIEGLYATSRFEGEAKLLRAVELLDQANFPIEL